MNDFIIRLIGIAASVCTAISLLPQLVKIIKEKKADDISMLTILVLIVGLSLWSVYGFLRNDWIIVISNIFSLIVNVLVVLFTLKYRKK